MLGNRKRKEKLGDSDPKQEMMARAPMVEDDYETEEKKQAAADVLYHYSQFVMVCIGEGVRPTDLSAALTVRCLLTEGSILLQLKRELSNSNLVSWQYGTDCCFWEGVACDPVSARVTSLNLSSRGISGKIVSTSALFNLTSLHYLNLAWNQFDPITLPASGFERLNNLTHLNLSNAGFIGQVPIGITHLTNLISLDLSVSYFTPDTSDRLILHDPSLRTLIGNLSNLRELYLDGSFISSEGSDWCRALSVSVPLLQVLSLSGCSLSGRIDPSLARLSSLTTINLRHNNFSSTVPEFFANFSSLSSLQLASCGLEGLFPQEVFQLKNLTHLDVSDNPMLFGNLPDFYFDNSLKILMLGSTRFSGAIPNSIGYLKSLTIHGAIPLWIWEIAGNHLLSLNLSHNVLTNVERFTGLIPSCLMEGGNILSVLNLRGNRLLRGTTLPNNFSRECSLQTLILNGNGIEGLLPKSLANCRMLELLDLGNNRIVDSFPFWLGNLSMLRVLILSSNQFYGSVELPLQGEMSDYHFPSLRILDLSSNIFTGNLSWSLFKNLTAMTVTSSADMEVLEFNSSILRVLRDVVSYPAFLLDSYYFSGMIVSFYSYLGTVSVVEKGQDITLEKILTAFTMIDLSNNQFHGAIPEVIGNLRSLRALNMSHNAFTGGIPSGFGGLAQLESLDLSSNQLSGEIPESLSSLTFLASLNLSYNSLVGRIPQGNQFATFANSSFEGNVGLCGRPLSKQCNSDSSSASAAPVSPSSMSKHTAWKHRAAMILLFLFVGLGIGVGFASVIVFQVVCRAARIWLNKLFIRR
ncbi:Receptor-like protein 12 [Ananas comosus]|uniref:Receptor-like protein 12 n=1 Tax=Ananas comosus TaxID=4615 RepID=A0A199UKS0_ANACO|nr:Receptor-like protein 12 [Ananas comosus]